MSDPLRDYLSSTPLDKVDPAMTAYLASLSLIGHRSPLVCRAIVKELADQRSNLKLIASENYSSLACQLAMGNLLTDKYAEGYAGHRFYAGCDNIDSVEAAACEEAMRLFGAEHAYVQPHSGADANLIAFWAVLSRRVEEPALAKLGESNPVKLERAQWDDIRRLTSSQRLLALDYYSGGHLTHGYRHNVSAHLFDVYSYAVDPSSGLLDYERIEAQAREVRPLILLAGYSAYPRHIDFRRMKQIADAVGAVLMVDMAHFAGLVAGKVFSGDHDPVAHADIVTTTTHKTLRGPRGGMILCRKEWSEAVDKGCPMVIGGPLGHVMAAKAVSFAEANTPEFRRYAASIVENARCLAAALVRRGLRLATGGTDNHLMLIDVSPYGLTGRQAESAMRECGITLNRNSLPFDPNGPWYTSGLRIGTPAVTTLGMGAAEMDEIADIMAGVLAASSPAAGKGGETSKAKYVLAEGLAGRTRERVRDLLARFRLYPELDEGFLRPFA